MGTRWEKESFAATLLQQANCPFPKSAWSGGRAQQSTVLRGTVPPRESMLPCRHPCSRMSSFLSLTHTWAFSLSQEHPLGLSSALCQHMHGLELANSEPTGCLFTEFPHNAVMISLTLSEAQPSMQSKRASTVPPLRAFWLFCEVWCETGKDTPVIYYQS